MPTKPSANIQNHINWCWATASKIVGIDYCASIQCSPANPMAVDAIAPRADLTGLRSEYVSCVDGQVMVDAWQQEIVLQAKDNDRNHDGNLAELDEGKCRALRYIVTGNPLSSSIGIISCGQYQSPIGLLSSEAEAVCEAISLKRSFIGNYVKHNGTSHSVVLRPENHGFITLYDPWDGFTDTLSLKQVFQTGFLTSLGPGIIKWIQYIR